MIPRIPSSDEMDHARMVAAMRRDGWSYIHPADIRRADEILRRREWWGHAVGIVGAVVAAMLGAWIAVAVWS